jgi:hypothetical protein
VSFANRKKKEKTLLKIALGISIVWVIVQIVLIVCFWGSPQFNDMRDYISIAQRCFNHGQWYPMAEDIYSTTWVQFIWAPGFINYLILQLRIFGTVNFNAVLNLFLNIAILLEVYYLSKKFFSKRTGLISVINYCFLYSNLLIVTGAYTEVPFMFLCLSALCLVFQENRKCIILAALLFGFANWIRPLAIIFLFASVVYFIITKTKFYNYIALIIPYILVLFIIGTLTEKKTGYFVYQSTTAGFNLMMISHDNAQIITHVGVFQEGNSGFIENSSLLTFAEKDSIWKVRSFEWIKEHPAKAIALYFIKIPALYAQDIWWISVHQEEEQARMEQRQEEQRNGTSVIFFSNEYIKRMLKKSLLAIPYYLIFLFFSMRCG